MCSFGENGSVKIKFVYIIVQDSLSGVFIVRCWFGRCVYEFVFGCEVLVNNIGHLVMSKLLVYLGNRFTGFDVLDRFGVVITSSTHFQLAVAFL